MADWTEAVSDHIGGKKSPKEIEHVSVEKAKSGGHIITHHHKNHPPEKHVTKTDKEMLAHMAASVGSGAPVSGDPTESAQAATPAAQPAPTSGAPAVAPVAQ